MSWRRFRAIVQRALFLPAQANRDLDDEIRFHLAEETRQQADRGLPADEAAAAARRAFGSVALAKENDAGRVGGHGVRAVRPGPSLRRADFLEVSCRQVRQPSP